MFVIELYVGLESFKSHSREFLSYELIHNIRETNSRKDAKIINAALTDIFGNFVFLKPGIRPEKAEMIARALKRESKIFWKDIEAKMEVVEKPKNYEPLRQRLLSSLANPEEEIEKLAEYIVIFFQNDKEFLRKLAIEYHYTAKQKEALSISLR